MNDSCANVFCSCSGARSGPLKNGDSTRCDSTRSLATRPAPPALSPTRAGDVGRRRVVVAHELGGRRRRRARLERRRLEAHVEAARDVARTRAGTAATRRRPSFVVPRDDVALRVEADLLIDHEREAVVLPRHFVLARELDAHRLADRLRQQRRIERHGVGAVDAVAARPAREHDVHGLGLARRAASPSCRAARTRSGSPPRSSPCRSARRPRRTSCRSSRASETDT